MLQALVAGVFAVLQAPVAPASEPAQETVSTPAAEPGPVAAAAAATPVAVAALPAEAPAPVASSTSAGAAAKPTPAVGTSEATLRTSKVGDSTPVTESSYKLGKGFTMATKDGRFSLQIRGRIQVRYDLEHYNTTGEAAKDVAHALQIRRLRLLLRGAVFSPFVKYNLQFGFAVSDMTGALSDESGSIRRNPVRDARIELDRLRDFNVWIGQFKVPFSRQRILSSSSQNMVDRSLVNAEFTLDRDLGVQFMSRDVGGLGGRLAYYTGVFMGEGRNAFALQDLGLLYVGRLEVRPMGSFEDYSEGDNERTPAPRLSIAGAYAFQDRAQGARGVIGDPPADGGTTNFHHVTADLMFKYRGFSFASAFHLRKGFARRSGGAVDENGATIATTAARSGVGGYAQIGYVVPKIPLEVAGRYGLVRNPYGAASSMSFADEVGGGLNYYFVGHDLKLQVDYFRLGDAKTGASTAEALRHGTDRVRVQVQLYF